MTRFYYPNITIGADTQTPQRTVDPAQLELMFVDDGSMDFLLSKVDVFGVYQQFASLHTTASDNMLARMLPMLAARGIKLGMHGGGPLGYGGTPNFVTGVNTPTEQGTLAAANDLAATGVYGYLESKGLTVDWNILDSPLIRVILNGSNKARHTAHHGFGVPADNTSVVYTATAAGAAGNSRTVAHVQSGNNTALSVVASTTKVLSDTFTRTVTDGWGSPDTGAAWSLTGTAANFDTDGSVGTIAVPTAGTTRRASNALTGNTANQRARTIFNLDAVPVGSTATYSLCLRQQDTSNYYEFRVTLKTDAALQAGIYKTVAGVTTLLDSTGEIFGLTNTAGKQWYLQASAIGTTLSITIWAVGTTKPAAANVTYIDSTYTTGSMSILCTAGGGYTSLPALFTMDELVVYDTDGDGNAVVVNLHTDGGGAVLSTAAQVIAAVNADFDASGLVIASATSPSTGVGLAPVFAATNLLFGDDGVNLSNTDTATAIVSYIGAIHAARPNMLFGFTLDIRFPWDGATGYTPLTYPTNQMPDFKAFWTIFWAQMGAAGLRDCFKLVVRDSDSEHDSSLIVTTTAVAHAVDWRGRMFDMQRFIEADGVALVENHGESSSGFPPLDDSNAIGPASESGYRTQILQSIRDNLTYREAHDSDLSKWQDFVFMCFSYYPRVLLPMSATLSGAKTYILAEAAFNRTDFQSGEGPELRIINPAVPGPLGLRLKVETPTNVLASGLWLAGTNGVEAALYRWERSTDQGVTWTEKGTGTITSGTWKYTVYDTTSASGYRYRARISKATPTFTTDYSAYGPVVTVP